MRDPSGCELGGRDPRPSARLARRIGMRQEGLLLENEWFKGEWTDELVFAVLDHEWRTMRDKRD